MRYISILIDKGKTVSFKKKGLILKSVIHDQRINAILAEKKSIPTFA